MDRALRANVITKSGKAVETAGDVDTLLLDKTGTITIGNRKATRFYPSAGVDEQHFVRACMLSSLSDETPEGKSIVELGRESSSPDEGIDTARDPDDQVYCRNPLFRGGLGRRYPDSERGFRFHSCDRGESRERIPAGNGTKDPHDFR